MAKNKKQKISNISKLLSATVQVEAFDSKTQKRSLGTGFIVADGSFAVTALHVVKNTNFEATEVNIFKFASSEKVAAFDWSRSSSIISLRNNEIVSSWNIDISIIRLKEKLISAFPVEFDTAAKTGEDVLFIGYPNGGAGFEANQVKYDAIPLITKGIVSSVHQYNASPLVEYYYWLDRPSFPGNSGGPVLRVSTGKVVGVISATPYMPKKIQIGSDLHDVFIPDGYSIAFGTQNITKIIENSVINVGGKNG